MTLTRGFRCRPESVTAARRFVREALAGFPQDVREAVELMTSELATNSVKHARTDFELRIDVGDQIRVEVRDSGAGWPEQRSPDVHDRTGRGLLIVEAMSSDWGVAGVEPCKSVWFTLAAPPPGSRGRATSGAGRGNGG